MPAPSANPPARSKLIWLAAIAALGIGWWIYHGRTVLSQDKQSANSADKGREGGGGRGQAQETPVAAAKARLGNIPVYLDGLGAVNAFYTVTVRSRVDGELMSMPVREGDSIKQGELLAQIDPRPYQVQLEQAEGQMARDQALLSNARLDLARYQTLLSQDAIPKQQLDTQRALVAQYEGTVKQDQAAMDTAKLQLTYARITAPISGRIGLRLVDPGNIVHASDANGIVVITQLQPIAVLFTIPEDNLPAVRNKLRGGATLPVQAFNRDRTVKLADGRLLTFDNQIDPQTGTSRLKAVFENRDSALFPNQFVNIRLLVETQHNQVLIPAVAIQRGQQGTFVYVVKADQTVEVRPVQLGVTEANDTSIAKGLQAGEVVVTDGSDRLQAGSKVRVRGKNSGAAVTPVS
ncbi:MAG: MdtA/MuxA family multidrug efflux RND transporter periplasmic adaptor subunit [Bryobacteraceae bacterium]